MYVKVHSFTDLTTVARLRRASACGCLYSEEGKSNKYLNLVKQKRLRQVKTCRSLLCKNDYFFLKVIFMPS